MSYCDPMHQAYVYQMMTEEFFIVVPKWMLNALQDPSAAMLLSEFISLHKNLSKNCQLHSIEERGDGWMFFTEEMCQERLCIGGSPFLKIRKRLMELGLIECVRYGLPSKNYYRPVFSSLAKWAVHQIGIFSKKVSSSHKNGRLETSNRDDSIYVLEDLILEEPKKDTHPSLTVGVAAGAAVSASVSSPIPTPKGETAPEAKRFTPPPPEQSHPLGKKPPTPKRLQSAPPPPADPDPHDEMQTFGEEGLVRLTPKQHASLLRHMTPEERDEWIIDLELEIAKRGPQAFAKRYKSHYHTILSWKRYREKDPRRRVGWSEEEAKIAQHRRGSKLVTPGDYKDDDFKRERI